MRKILCGKCAKKIWNSKENLLEIKIQHFFLLLSFKESSFLFCYEIFSIFLKKIKKKFLEIFHKIWFQLCLSPHANAGKVDFRQYFSQESPEFFSTMPQNRSESLRYYFLRHKSFSLNTILLVLPLEFNVLSFLIDDILLRGAGVFKAYGSSLVLTLFAILRRSSLFYYVAGIIKFLSLILTWGCGLFYAIRGELGIVFGTTTLLI